MSFGEAAKEVWHSCKTRVISSTARRTNQRHGRAAEAVTREEVKRLEVEAPDATTEPGQIVVSVDGALIPLINGEWREVKSMAIGSFESKWRGKKGKTEVKTEELTYFSRSYRIREFERFALGELHHRGVDNANKVVAVNDGADWIQQFLDYHCPNAIRIIDFWHATDYLAKASKAVYGEGTKEAKRWFHRSRSRLKRRPVQQTLANLALLQQKAETEEQRTVVDCAHRYIKKRVKMMDYPHFQRRGLPIGSGSVESSHTSVVHKRMKGAGMRWALANVDPMLTLRNLICNDRWDEGWQDIVLHHQQQRAAKVRQRATAKQPPPSEPITFESLEAAGLLSKLPLSKPEVTDKPKSRRPADDHPWRNNKWPTKESWRWK